MTRSPVAAPARISARLPPSLGGSSTRVPAAQIRLLPPGAERAAGQGQPGHRERRLTGRAARAADRWPRSRQVGDSGVGDSEGRIRQVQRAESSESDSPMSRWDGADGGFHMMLVYIRCREARKRLFTNTANSYTTLPLHQQRNYNHPELPTISSLPLPHMTLAS